MRGLEILTPQGRDRRMGNRRRAWTSVFEEQDFQMHNGIYEPEIMAGVYSYSTKASQLAAQTLEADITEVS
jgi:hypothetical protein